MIIGCPNCETKYNLPDDKIPPEGRKVKCAKCQHVFKAAPPPATPEDEVEVLLDEENQAPAPDDSDSDFDQAFEEAVAAGEDDDQDDDEDAGGDEDDFGAGLDEDEESPDEDLDGDFEDDIEDEDEDFADDEDEEIEDGDEFDEEDLEDEEESLFPLDGDDDMALDSGKKGKKNKGRKGKKKGRPLLLLFLLLLILAAAAVATFNVGLWNERDFMADPPMVELPFELPVNIPFLRGPQEAEPPEPGESPTEKIKYIQPVDFRQYIITNEQAGPVFVVEGKALNKFTVPKERIKVRVTLFDGQGNVLASRDQLCGNTLSLFQLQVQSRQEIEEALDSQAGIYANNTYIKPGETTPFMVVFFEPPAEVEEYQIKIVDARDPDQ